MSLISLTSPTGNFAARHMRTKKPPRRYCHIDGIIIPVIEVCSIRNADQPRYHSYYGEAWKCVGTVGHELMYKVI